MFEETAEQKRDARRLASMGRVDELRDLLKQAPEKLNAPDDMHGPPLWCAITSISYHTKQAALMLLREFDADLHQQFHGRNIMHVVAAARPPTRTLRDMFPDAADEQEAEYTAVLHEIFYRLRDDVWDMLATWQDAPPTPLHTAAAHDNEIFITELHKLAVERGQRRILKHWAEYHDEALLTPVAEAARQGCAHAVTALCEAVGVDPNVPCGTRGLKPIAPLIHAAYLREWVGYRYSNSAGFVKDNSHVTACVKALVAAGADPNCCDESGTPVLHLVAARQNWGAAIALITHAACVHQRDGAGELFTAKPWRLRDGWNNLQTEGAMKFVQEVGSILASAIPQIATLRREPAVMLRGLAHLRRVPAETLMAATAAHSEALAAYAAQLAAAETAARASTPPRRLTSSKPVGSKAVSASAPSTLPAVKGMGTSRPSRTSQAAPASSRGGTRGAAPASSSTRRTAASAATAAAPSSRPAASLSKSAAVPSVPASASAAHARTPPRGGAAVRGRGGK